ncbi:MAG: uracil-DNA glycosylase [Syntrophales bacterium]|jgi:DNA polymerase|nr:uracil-DNA glycosylase [Syntrophales bacterium]NLN60898.1 uracil-DNA glycosylase [Deltaproteobacteria bacterium]
MVAGQDPSVELLEIIDSLITAITLDREKNHPLSYLGVERSDVSSVHYAEVPGNDEFEKETLQAVHASLGDCRRCGLHATRRNIVFGEGSSRAQVVFVGEAPGEDEDRQGRPFVGRAGQLLTKIIEAMSLTRGEVYICNILKCRPPGNRNPLPGEILACEPFLIRQMEAIKPRVICALGTFAARTLLKNEAPITTMRGRFHNYHGIPLMPTYHPAYLLRNASAKKLVWEDVQQIMKRLQTVEKS